MRRTWSRRRLKLLAEQVDAERNFSGIILGEKKRKSSIDVEEKEGRSRLHRRQKATAATTQQLLAENVH